MSRLSELTWSIDEARGRLADLAPSQRRLRDLPELFEDEAAYRDALADENALVYSVSSVESQAEPGALSFGLGRIEPGRVGREFHMTKGHVHAWRPASEVYVALQGCGVMLLHDLERGEDRAVPFTSGDIVFVPGGVAHRTVNVGEEALSYLGIYPSEAGHDYAAVVEQPFPRRVVATDDGGWTLRPAGTSTTTKETDR